MQSSFEKEYTKQHEPDGSIVLSFKSIRFSPKMAHNIGFVSFFTVFPLCLILVGQIAAKFDLAFWVWPVFSLAMYFGVMYSLVRFLTSDDTLTIKPWQGLMFDGKYLPYADIQSLGVTTHPNAKKKHNSSVYAQSHGKEIKVAGYFSEALAASIAKEITDHTETLRAQP